MLKEFGESIENFEPIKNNKNLIDALEICIKRMTGIIEIKHNYEIGAETILISLKKFWTFWLIIPVL